MKKILGLLTLTLSIAIVNSNILKAQDFNSLNIDFIVNGVELNNPLAGGLNAPQISEVDLNNDGTLDLYIFDRIGDMHLTFLNEGTSGETNYVFAPQFARHFPYVRNFVLLRDFNADGAMDLFCHSELDGVFSFQVYQGFFQDNKLNFERILFPDFEDDVLHYTENGSEEEMIQVSAADYPAMVDVDSDGDLDLLTFNISGSYVEYFQNMVLELGYNLDTLIFEKTDACWGKFYEANFSQEISLSDNSDECSNGFTGPPVVEDRNIHPGSSLLAFDENNDGALEMVIGDIINNRLIKLDNGGTSELAWMNNQDATYPSYNVPVDIPEFPASFYLDLDNDGLKDFVVCANNLNNTPDLETIWFYKNMTSNELPEFELQQKDLLGGEMIDLGSGANPAFVDYNADGLFDLVVGNFSYYQLDFTKDSRLFLYENIGTTTEPKFELIDDNWLNFQQYNSFTWAFAPTFGDIDDDGDLDLLVGERFGNLFFAENTAGEGNPLQFGAIQINWQNINVGQFSVPQIVDMNRDGKMDLVIGERNLNMNYLPNQGSAQVPEFHPVASEAPNNQFFGDIDTSEPLLPTGYGAPVVLDFGDNFKLVTGSELGFLEFYQVNEDNLEDGSFDLLDESFGNIRTGDRTKPAIADLNNDGVLDIIVGNYRGGLTAFKSNLTVDGMVGTNDVIENSDLKLFPNPANNVLNIELVKNEIFDGKYLIFNGVGQLVQSGQFKSSQFEVNLEMLAGGIYFCKIENNGLSMIRKFIKESNNK